MAEITRLGDRASWAGAAVDRIEQALAAALDRDGEAFFAGAGGSTPAPIYRALATRALDWARVTVTLVDERYVPPSSPDSNARLLFQTLLTGPAAAARLLPLYSAEVTADRAALKASRALADVGRPLDAVLLGMGEDGHICSMFPDSLALPRLLAPSPPPAVIAVARSRSEAPPPQERLSLNIPWLASAGVVVLAITGETKRSVFERELEGDAARSPIAALAAARRETGFEVIWTEAEA